MLLKTLKISQFNFYSIEVIAFFKDSNILGFNLQKTKHQQTSKNHLFNFRLQLFINFFI
jgi:hypothetical protein